MHQFTPLFRDLFNQSPLPLQGVEQLALQLAYLQSQGAMWEAFQEAARAAPPSTQQELEDWLQNHWNQLSRNTQVPDYEREILRRIRQQLDDGSLAITGFSTEEGLHFTRSTEVS